MIPKFQTIYRVTKDVANPKPDRRTAAREIFKQPVIKAGTRLVCRAEKREVFDAKSLLSNGEAHYEDFPILEPAGRGYYQTGSWDNRISATRSPQAADRKGEPYGPTLWSLLTEDGVLEEIAPEDVDDTLLALDQDVSATCILEVLFRAGRISLDDVRAAYMAWEDSRHEDDRGNGREIAAGKRLFLCLGCLHMRPDKGA